ncbi:hypothetical protein [Polynucleobacter sp. es-EL-1]|uniref:hypothetical protein n=1 Tax=Polynucleobacter sp. es-EL-1 TaxID=1855652 RepID=UPI001BFCFD47|nr:hypothetical protein [Polynucleobacter sp. es-EL-1]QWE11172.1 hypothetical protein FD974_03295 [Polynucleobacter sp. es-EL-1]
MTALLREPSQLLTRESPRQIIYEDFNIDLPIAGGWGYDLDTACVINKYDSMVNPNMPFDGVGIEYLFVEKRIYEEMIIFRQSDEKYSGIRWDLEKQELISRDDRRYDKLVFSVLGFSDAAWSEITDRFEAIQKSGELEKMVELDRHRESKAYRFKREFYFEITSFYGT